MPATSATDTIHSGVTVVVLRVLTSLTYCNSKVAVMHKARSRHMVSVELPKTLERVQCTIKLQDVGHCEKGNWLLYERRGVVPHQ
ncbi:hypothetical protein PISMIDRAFT_673249 [Pisolithus microcarpus 441]|uniref:Uncharacterized protein n=1 Tax=Pisolithus microcarpus 441 TaxID=765257 RepID=A0A0C9ZIB8_9AGAM|nr:hypothetical protein PISMIDRAFT_673249 [Pisolithus microcarpus 441]